MVKDKLKLAKYVLFGLGFIFLIALFFLIVKTNGRLDRIIGTILLNVTLFFAILGNIISIIKKDKENKNPALNAIIIALFFIMIMFFSFFGIAMQ